MVKIIKILRFLFPSQKDTQFVCEVFKIATKVLCVRESKIIKHSAISFSHKDLKCYYSLTHNKTCINTPESSSFISPILNIQECDVFDKKTLNPNIAAEFGLNILKLSSHHFFNKSFITAFDNSKMLVYRSNSNKITYHFDKKETDELVNSAFDAKKLNNFKISKKEFSKIFTAEIIDFKDKNYQEWGRELHIELNSKNFKLSSHIDQWLNLKFDKW